MSHSIACLCLLGLFWSAPAFGQTVSVQSGNFNAGSTWVGGSVPTGPFVVSAGHTVTCDSPVDVPDRGWVDGTFRALPGCDFHWTVDQATANAQVWNPDCTSNTNVFLCARSGGVIEMAGTPVLRNWGRLTAGAAVTDTQITVEGALEDWPVGSRVVLTQTRPAWDYTGINYGYNPPRQNATLQYDTEIRTVTAVAPGPRTEWAETWTTTLTLDPPLAKPHPILHDGLLRPAVGLLTKDVRFRTTIVGADLNDVRNRKFAYLQFLPGSFGRLEDTSFEQCGAYGQKGAYCIHVHQLGEGSRGFVIRRVSFQTTGLRCTNIHSSHGVLIEDTVAYDPAGGNCHYIEVDAPTPDLRDIAQVHNLVASHRPVHWNDRANPAVFGEMGRGASGFWSATVSEAFLGNLSAGPPPDGLNTTCTHWPEISTAMTGTLPHLYGKHECVALSQAGFYSWQNRGELGRDLFDIGLFNSPIGFEHGAYSDPIRLYRSVVFGNRIGYVQHVDGGFSQDVAFRGSGEAASVLLTPDHGVLTAGSTLQPLPFHPARYRRVSFDALSGDYLSHPGAAFTLELQPCPDSTQEVKALSGSCITDLMEIAQATYETGIRPITFGDTTNANTFIVDYVNARVLTRADQNPPGTGTEFPPFFVNGSTAYDAGSNANSTPLGALPSAVTFPTTITSYRGWPYGPNTFPLTYDAPPTIDVALSRTTASPLTIAATATVSDTTTAEFWSDWNLQVTRTAAPWTAALNLTPATDAWFEPRRYAYVWARAFDGTNIDGGLGENGFVFPSYPQRAYSRVTEYGPEVLYVEAGQIGVLNGQIATLQAQIAAAIAQLQESPPDVTTACTVLGGNCAQAPSITTPPSHQTVTAPAPATFSVVAGGTAPLTYQWRRNTTNISGATGTSYTLDPTAVSDTGASFDVVVSNTYGSVTSAAAILTVNAGGGGGITLVGTAANGGQSTAASVTHGLTIAAGDLVLAFLNINGNRSLTDNNGSQPFTEQFAAVPGTQGVHLQSRVASASEPATYQWTVGASDRWSVVLRVYRGVHANTWGLAPAEYTDADNEVGSPMATTASPLTTTVNGEVAIVWYGLDAAGTTFGAPSGSYGNVASHAGNQGQLTADKLITVAGTLSQVTATHTSSGTTRWGAYHFTVRPQ